MPRLIALAPHDIEPHLVHLSPEEFAAILAELEADDDEQEDE